MNALRTPEQVAADLGGPGIMSPHTIRALIRAGKVEYTKLARGKFALTDEQVDAMLHHMRVAPTAVVERPAESVFGSTKTRGRKP